jgi:hypothetical protein
MSLPGELLKGLSKKLIHLSGNDLINKRLNGKGTGGTFNVCDEIPQFILNQLLDGKKFRIAGMLEPDDYLTDERTPTFRDAWKIYLSSKELDEDSLEEDEIRERKDQLRISLGMRPAHEFIPSKHSIELPRTSLNEEEKTRHADDKLQTDLSTENLKKCLVKIEKERIRFEREKGLQTLYAAFGFLEWEQSDEKRFTSPILLIRVTIEKGNGENSYKISASGDLESNQSLCYALLQKTGIQPPEVTDFFSENGHFNINDLYNLFEIYIKKYPSWKILNRISVGIFKSRGIPFSEILPIGYSEENVTAAEKILVGKNEIATNSGTKDVDGIASRKLVPSFALNADSSQHAAILEVAEGKNLVIEGPPGAGKSQTIVNLISNALYQGKSVLFLAQKLAALEVVNNRLENVGLGKKCLSLHSEYTRKSILFENLSEKLKKTTSGNKVSQSQFVKIQEERDEVLTKLNDHAYKMCRNVFESEDQGEIDEDTIITHHVLTTYTLLKNILETEQTPEFKVPANYDLRGLKHDLELAGQLEEMISKIELSHLKLLSNLYLSDIPNPFQADEIFEKTANVLVNLNRFSDGYEQMELDRLEKFYFFLLDTHSEKVRFEDYEKKLSVMLGERSRPSYQQANQHLIALGEHPSKAIWIKSIFFPWTRTAKAKKFFQDSFAFKKVKLKKIQEEALAFVSNLRIFELAKKNLTKAGSTYLDTNAVKIKEQAQWVSERLEEVKVARNFAEQVSFSLRKVSAEEIRTQLSELLSSKHLFRDLCEINSYLLHFEQRLNCGGWLRELIIDSKPLKNLLEASLYKFFSMEIAGRNPELFSMDGKEMERLREKFNLSEKKCRTSYIKQIAGRMPKAKDLPRYEKAYRVRDYRGQQLLNHVSKITNARITVRELCFRALDTLLHYTPCLLMTPSSVADYVPKNTKFDLVIIDEASQMLPEEAIGSILRSDQIVVVGDPKQMPPTRYMQSTLEDEIDQEDDIIYSILDKAMLAFPHFRRLCYHYRSEDESLIRFSNNEFYENDLLTVPNLRNDNQMGVKFVNANGIYDTGNANIVSVDEHGKTSGWNPSKNPNPIEAQKLVEIILHEIRERPDWSIGVAVMNLKQAIRIEELFQEKIDNQTRGYLNKWKNTPEYFFIKNLENVQGDERDTIIIATVYGKNHEGKMFQRFGPINMEKGENRINVLVTRAKKRVVVCSSMQPNDITANNAGAQVLRRFLQYAKTGQLEENSRKILHGCDHDYNAPWEKWFRDRLEQDGYIVNPRVGVSGWRIDLGVMHKDYPDGYLCGIELDGKDHLQQSARDRDIERQGILESKGWTILRVWSIDFFNDMEGEYQILKSAVDEILSDKIKNKNKVEKNRPEEKIFESQTETDLLEY